MFLQVLEQRAAGAVDDALRLAGGTGGVHHVQRVVERQAGEIEGRLGMLAAGPRDGVLDVAEQGHPQEVLDGADCALYGVRPFADVEPLATVVVAVAGDQHLGLDLSEPVERPLDTEVGRARGPDRAQACRREHGDNRLGNVGQPAGNAVPGRDTEFEEGLTEGRRLVSEFPVGEGATLAVLENRHDGHLIVAVAKQILCEVQTRVGEPPAAGEPLAVDDHGTGATLADNVAEVPHRLPELAPPLDGIAVQGRIVRRREAQRPGETRQVGVGDGGGTWPPQFGRHRRPSQAARSSPSGSFATPDVSSNTIVFRRVVA